MGTENSGDSKRQDIIVTRDAEDCAYWCRLLDVKPALLHALVDEIGQSAERITAAVEHIKSLKRQIPIKEFLDDKNREAFQRLMDSHSKPQS